MSRHVVQLSTAQSVSPEGEVVRTVYALDNFGALWMLSPAGSDAQWQALPGLPQEDVGRGFFDFSE